MAGKQFIKRRFRIVICLLGMLVVGMTLYSELPERKLTDTVTLLRIGVFLGFAFFLTKSIVEILRRKQAGEMDNVRRNTPQPSDSKDE